MASVPSRPLGRIRGIRFYVHRLRNEDFEFPDLLDAAYKYLIGEFAIKAR